MSTFYRIESSTDMNTIKNVLVCVQRLYLRQKRYWVFYTTVVSKCLNSGIMSTLHSTNHLTPDPWQPSHDLLPGSWPWDWETLAGDRYLTLLLTSCWKVSVPQFVRQDDLIKYLTGIGTLKCLRKAWLINVFFGGGCSGLELKSFSIRRYLQYLLLL